MWLRRGGRARLAGVRACGRPGGIRLSSIATAVLVFATLILARWDVAEKDFLLDSLRAQGCPPSINREARWNANPL